MTYNVFAVTLNLALSIYLLRQKYLDIVDMLPLLFEASACLRLTFMSWQRWRSPFRPSATSMSLHWPPLTHWRCCTVLSQVIVIIIIIIMLTFIMHLLLQDKNIGAVQNTNSGRRNLLNVKSHIIKIGFELVLKNNTVWYGAQFCRKTVPCKREGTFSELGLQMRYGVAGGVWGGTQVRACYSCRRELQCIREITWSLPNMDVMHYSQGKQRLKSCGRQTVMLQTWYAAVDYNQTRIFVEGNCNNPQV